MGPRGFLERFRSKKTKSRALGCGFQGCAADRAETPGLEGIPGRLGGELQVPDVEPEAAADAGSDRDDDDVVRGDRGYAEAADQVGRAVDTDEPTESNPTEGPCQKMSRSPALRV